MNLESYEAIITISEDYFTVFSQNAGRIGTIGDMSAQQVIKAYMETKGLFDSVRMYVEQCKELTMLKVSLRRMEIEGQQEMPAYKSMLVEEKFRDTALQNYISLLLDDFIPRAVGLLAEAESSLRKGVA